MALNRNQIFSSFTFDASFGSTAFAQTTSLWPKVPPADFSKLKPSDFADDELDLPYYLAHFHRLANSVVEEGDNRGFINISVWRNPQDNKPYNARVMENILSLAFFYSTKRPWNQYYGSPAVRLRWKPRWFGAACTIPTALQRIRSQR